MTNEQNQTGDACPLTPCRCDGERAVRQPPCTATIERLTAERDEARQERDRLLAYRDRLLVERERLTAERDEARREVLLWVKERCSWAELSDEIKKRGWDYLKEDGK